MIDYSSEEFWKGAPEGATHYQPAKDENHSPVFWRVVDGVAHEGWCPSAFGGANTANFKYGPNGNDCFDVARSVTRPAPPWSGDGLPPVGTVCELSSQGAGWGIGTIQYTAENVVVWRWNNQAPGQACACYKHEVSIRTIRTQAQIEAEEREKFARNLVHQMGKHPVKNPNSMAQARKIYDLGYRLVKP